MRTDRVNSDQGRVFSKVRPVLLCLSAGAVVLAVALVAFSALLTAQSSPQAMISPLSIVASILGALVAGLVTARLTGRQGALYGAITGLLLFGVLFAISLVTWHEQFDVQAIIRLAAMILAGALGGILGVNLKKR